MDIDATIKNFGSRLAKLESFVEQLESAASVVDCAAPAESEISTAGEETKATVAAGAAPSEAAPDADKAEAEQTAA